MQSAITYDIKVSVEAMYQPMYSKPINKEFVHAYRITIENMSDEPIQLLSRYWFIWDSTSKPREVEGDGVVGKQPIIQPGDSYQYVSGCPLSSTFGYMNGHYIMIRQRDQRKFQVQVPTFELVPNFILN